jgi:dihydropyrimidinase
VRVGGGIVVAPDGAREADVVLEEGRIVAVERPSRGADLDAGGCIVLPGGVDPHVHPLADLADASAAAVRGGTTTMLAFTSPRRGETVVEAFLRTREEVRAAPVDVRLHATVAEPETLDVAQLAELAQAGARGLKLYLAYPELGLLPSDRTLYETLRDAARLGLLVLVHCESSGAIEALVDEALAAGRTDVRAFAATRPPLVEEEGVARTLAYARLARAPVYLVHLTAARSLALVREARLLGQTVYAEACTHHLLLDERCYDRGDGERYAVVPPLRPRPDVEALWAAIADGTLDTVGSDHAQERYRPDAPAGDFRALQYGFFGVDVRVPLLLSEGARRGVPVERLADLVAGAPARIFGLAPQKGAVVVGSDADLVVWDPEAASTVPGEPPFGGLEVRGAIRHVLVRGLEVEVG